MRKRNVVLLWGLISGVLIGFPGCEKSVSDNSLVGGSSNMGRGPVIHSGDNGFCDPIIKTFYAGQTLDVGSVTTMGDDHNLYVQITTRGSWMMEEAHLYVGLRESMPQVKKGNPKVGQFPYKMDFKNKSNDHVFILPMDEVNGDCFIIAVHAKVNKFNDQGEIIQSESAWADGERMVEKGNWATYFNHCKCVTYVSNPANNTNNNPKEEKVWVDY